MEREIPNTRSDGLSDLRRTIQNIERRSQYHARTAPISFGTAEIDVALPWGGLARGGLHEINGDGGNFGFHAGLLRRAVGENGNILWCRHAGVERETGRPYGPGLMHFGLNADQFLFVRSRHAVDILWAMEEGLRTPGLAAVVGDGIAPDFTATRRLQLAAEATNIPAFILLPPRVLQQSALPSAALTRWDIKTTCLAETKGSTRWQADLLRCRGGVPKNWIIEWNEQTLCFHLADILAGGANATYKETA